MLQVGSNQRLGRTCGVQGRIVEPIDPNQGIEGLFTTSKVKGERSGQVKRSEGDQMNYDESLIGKKKGVVTSPTYVDVLCFEGQFVIIH